MLNLLLEVVLKANEFEEMKAAALADAERASKEAEEAKKRARVAGEIRHDLLATPTQVAEPLYPVGAFAYMTTVKTTTS